MATNLTAKGIESLVRNPPKSRAETADAKARGLYLIVQPSGAATWAFRYRAGGRSKKLTLGPYPAMDIATARIKAAQAAVDLANGTDPAYRKQADKAALQPKDAELVENVVALFIERHAKVKTRASSSRETERILTNEVVKRWRGRSIKEIKKTDIHEMLDSIIDRRKPIAANRTLAAVRRMLNWSLERGILDASPAAGIKAPAPAKSRDRVLSDWELKLVWHAAEELGWPFGPIVHLLILTGQRRDEVGGMTWSEIDLNLSIWTLPEERTKNGLRHSVPLSDEAAKIIKGLPAIKNKHGFVFTTNRETAVSGFQNAKEKLDRLIAKAAGETVVPGWTLHDLRRTMASGCASQGVAPHVVEAILNHKSGSISGVAAVYNRYDHAAEKRDALDTWAEHVKRITAK